MINEKLELAFLLKDICNKFDNNKYRLVNNTGEVFQSKFLFLYYFLVNSKTYNNKYISIIKDYFDKVERIYPGSSYFLSKTIYKKLLNKKLNKDFKSVETNIKNIKKYFKQERLSDNFKKVLSVIEFTGPDGSIICKESKNDSIVCERKDRSIFSLKISEDLNYLYFSNKNKVSNNFFVSICDAFIEKESCLIPAIEKSVKNKKNLVIICRGISKFASDQIKSIMSRNKILIYIYTDKFDQNDPFKFKDLSDILNLDILSPEKGSIIVRDIFESTKLIQDLTLTSETIYFKSIKNSILEKEINKSISNCKEETLKEYLNFRKKRIFNKISTIYIPNKNKNLIQDFKDIINSYNIILKYGLIENEEKLYSKLIFKKTLTMSDNFYNTINKIGMIVKESKNEKI